MTYPFRDQLREQSTREHGDGTNDERDIIRDPQLTQVPDLASDYDKNSSRQNSFRQAIYSL